MLQSIITSLEKEKFSFCLLPMRRAFFFLQLHEVRSHLIPGWIPSKFSTHAELTWKKEQKTFPSHFELFLFFICCCSFSWRYSLSMKHSWTSINPLGSKSDQHQFSPNNINTSSSKRLWEWLNWLPKGECFDLKPNSLNYYEKKCMEISLENLHVDLGA